MANCQCSELLCTHENAFKGHFCRQPAKKLARHPNYHNTIKLCLDCSLTFITAGFTIKEIKTPMK